MKSPYEEVESMKITINESIDSFRMLRESGAYYVDKTLLLKEYLADRFKSCVLFARPRRFGKTMAMTMFRDFLDIHRDSKAIFEGLKIMEYPEVVDKFHNQYPVVFLSLKEVFGKSFDSVFDNLQVVVSNLCSENAYLLASPTVDDADKEFMNELRFRRGKQSYYLESLSLLARMLHAHYGKPAFVIVDEYDVPMAKALGTPFYDQVRDMVEHMLSYVCKTNANVKAVLLSGCLYTVKNSTYTGVNNIVPYTILSPAFASGIGFTDEDIRKLLSDAGLSDRYEDVETWYDGYIFGRERMYCPWDVMRYVASILEGTYSEAKGPESYWLNTSETSQNLIHGFLGKTNAANESFEQLLAGKCVECKVNEQVPYHQIYENGDNLWTALLETGYLSKAVTENAAILPLRLPNRSVEAAFRQEVWDYFRDKVDNAFVRDFVSALWAGETSRAEAAICQILEATLSFYHEYREYSYHLILDGFFTGQGCTVLSEPESGYGRSDLIILDLGRKRCLILELKHVKDEKDLEAALQEGASQLICQKYESTPRYLGFSPRLKYAMAFSGKTGRIKLA